MNSIDYKNHVVIPTLEYLSPEIPFSDEAVNLILLTAIAESNLSDLVQQGGGPALGLLQMEPDTESSLWTHQLRLKRPKLAELILNLIIPGISRKSNLTANPMYGVAMARVKYWNDPMSLPAITDINGMSNYYIRIYNGGGKAGFERTHSIYRYRILK